MRTSEDTAATERGKRPCIDNDSVEVAATAGQLPCTSNKREDIEKRPCSDTGPEAPPVFRSTMQDDLLMKSADSKQAPSYAERLDMDSDGENPLL